MHVLLTGATGHVGRFIAHGLEAAGHRVTPLGRRPGQHPWSLADPAPALPPADALVHAAFEHRPGAYRGGEGCDPARFWRLNHDGSCALFAAAGHIPRWLFLSSRSVYGDHRRGVTLWETDEPAPDSLYGELKLAVETAMADLARGRATAASLRATGVYGVPPGLAGHKWSGLFRDYLAGRAIAPRCGSEIHGADLAAAVLRLLEHRAAGAFNASDLLLDRHDLLTRLRVLTGCPHEPPPKAREAAPGVMSTHRLASLGWQPGGWPRLDAFLRAAAGHQQGGPGLPGR